jgi:hypothetical protein
MLDDVRAHLATHGLTLGIAELHKEPQVILDRSGTLERIGRDMVFVDLEDARDAALKLDLSANVGGGTTTLGDFTNPNPGGA